MTISLYIILSVIVLLGWIGYVLSGKSKTVAKSLVPPPVTGGTLFIPLPIQCHPVSIPPLIGSVLTAEKLFADYTLPGYMHCVPTAKLSVAAGSPAINQAAGQTAIEAAQKAFQQALLDSVENGSNEDVDDLGTIPVFVYRPTTSPQLVDSTLKSLGEPLAAGESHQLDVILDAMRHDSAYAERLEEVLLPAAKQFEKETGLGLMRCLVMAMEKVGYSAADQKPYLALFYTSDTQYVAERTQAVVH